MAELEKILLATNNAKDLTLCVRIAASSQYSHISLASKFGVRAQDAPSLLFATRQVADTMGICFHVGSQCMVPSAYSQALALVRQAIVQASVTIDIIDVGGGFPSIYPGKEAFDLESCFRLIHREFEELPVSYSAELWCEPGRALCAEYSSLLVRVEKRENNMLYINDGAYGSLFDAAHLGWSYPAQLIRAVPSKAALTPFQFYGPTCDDLDHMPGPFLLPEDTQVDDYIELGMLGAYGQVMRTQFNGFGENTVVQSEDEPMHSAYTWAPSQDHENTQAQK